jgi:hypothetical protein
LAHAKGRSGLLSALLGPIVTSLFPQVGQGCPAPDGDALADPSMSKNATFLGGWPFLIYGAVLVVLAARSCPQPLPKLPKQD